LAIGLLVGLTFGLLVALTFGLAIGPAIGLVGGLTFGLTLGPVFGLMSGPTVRRWLTDEPAYANLQLTQRVTLLTRRLVVGLAVGLVVGTAVGVAVGLVVGLPAGLIGGLAIGLVGGLTGWVGIPDKIDWASGPQSTHTATRTLTVLQLCLGVLVAGLAVGLAGWLTAGLTVRLMTGLTAGVAGGLAASLTGGLAARRAGRLVIRSGAWLTYLPAVCRLAACGKLPFRLMAFLDDAYRLGLLRTVGPAYQFRHAEFQDHLVRTADTQAAVD
jgi:hypothetical protein